MSRKKGRKQLPIITENYICLGPVQNNSGRYFWKCQHCGNDPNSKGASIEGCDNRLLQHLADTKQCPQVPLTVLVQAYNCITGKGPEYVRVIKEDKTRLKELRLLMLLFDGWEDALKRSIYGTIAAKVNHHPIPLSLDDITRQRGNADTLVETTEKALRSMELQDMRNFAAVTTDNPTTMRKYRRLLQKKYPWLLLFACFLHGMNTIIGSITTFDPMKKILQKVTTIVTFFTSSHYWGAQLKEEAEKVGITTSLKKNCKSRWYTLVLHCMSVQRYREPLFRICYRQDAEKSTNGLSIIPKAIRETVLGGTETFWPLLNQFIRTTKPLVDAIGNVEAHDATLADCMLELVRCVHTMTKLRATDDKDHSFLMHARSTFNRLFHQMDTKYHSLALYLQPLCRRLAISQVANGRSFAFMEKAAVEIVKKWRWGKLKALALQADLKLYHQCKSPFAGGQADALDWWESLPVTSAQHPLKALAITLHSIVPHAAEIERLFAMQGGTQSARRCCLSVETFEKLGKHAHMHTRDAGGINVGLAEDLERNFAWVPPLVVEGEPAAVAPVESPEDEFVKEQRAVEAARALDPEDKLENSEDGVEVLEGKLYDFEELQRVDKGLAPPTLTDDVEIIGKEDEEDVDWDVEEMAAGDM
ncbi:hypothetical protein L226DRAFT_548734 [Lentinus tigrinus ALCF2SS1-7]|uniref:uncharacterized protein n=1 Tax=Lentinus tigrinus ALCF2SS1-7 TaxID=1328758 RepID=UPI001165CE44|nr:hypothetical protein L226DRAFT_548734 [Lentinus tigrinus ALCF2SS1-7]